MKTKVKILSITVLLSIIFYFLCNFMLFGLPEIKVQAAGTSCIFRANLDSGFAYRYGDDNVETITELRPAVIVNNYKFILSDGTNYITYQHNGETVVASDLEDAKIKAQKIDENAYINLLALNTHSFEAGAYKYYKVSDLEGKTVFVIDETDTITEVPLINIANEFRALSYNLQTAYRLCNITNDGVAHFADDTTLQITYYSTVVLADGQYTNIITADDGEYTNTGDSITSAAYVPENSSLNITYTLGTVKYLDGSDKENLVESFSLYSPSNICVRTESNINQNSGNYTITDLLLSEAGEYTLYMYTNSMTAPNYVTPIYKITITEEQLQSNEADEIDFIDKNAQYNEKENVVYLTLTSHFGNSYIFKVNGEVQNNDPLTSITVKITQNGEVAYEATNSSLNIKGYVYVNSIKTGVSTPDNATTDIAEPLEENWVTDFVDKLAQTGMEETFPYVVVAIILVFIGGALVISAGIDVHKQDQEKEVNKK